jgi:hypothetical protein
MFAMSLLAGGCGAKGTTLEDLAQRDDVRADSSFSADQCACQCGQPVCWDFTCSGPRCSRADDYELRVKHGPESASNECLDELNEVTVRLVATGAEPPAPDFVSNVCGTLDITWRIRPGQFDRASSHRVEISDASATWTIEDPFLTHALAIVAPASATMPDAGAPRVIHRGEQLIVGVSPPVTSPTVSATIWSMVVGATRTSALSSAVLDDGRIAIAIPPDTAVGGHRIGLELGIALAADACRGPDTCHAVSTGTTWEVRIE